ncbi:MAG TPA: ABC transporter permease, partial [Candidatus Sulfotelmatobacter sp.]|nr:ABC transporter permease [Candidatus Sulfotelmatobacter sp.]
MPVRSRRTAREVLQDLREQYGPPLHFLIVVIILWELAAWALGIPDWLFPPPHRVAQRFLEARRLGFHTAITLSEALAGFGLSAVLGPLVAAGIANMPFLERGVFPYIVLANAVPIVAIAPLLTVWLGFGVAPKIAVAMIITFFPIVTNTARGLSSADYRIIRMMRSLNASRFEIFRKIQVPTALPYIFAGFKISLSLSLIGAVVGEFYGGGDKGLGYLITVTAAQFDTPLLFVAVGILAVSGVMFFQVTALFERRLIYWA